MNILSIQSHVAYGYVGNAAATFPLQRMGIDVWPVHTVNFSNHAGYETVRGPVMCPAQISDILTGIEERGVLKDCDAVLSGYLGDSALGALVLDMVRRVREKNPDAFYCCDPVMGDERRNIYVREGIPSLLRDKAIPAADIITPNLFELSLLAGGAFSNMEAIVAAARAQLARGPKIVLVTSVPGPEGIGDSLSMVAVTKTEALQVSTPRIAFEITPNGAGDVTAALFLGHVLKGGSLPAILEKVAGAIYAMFEQSRKTGSRELQIVAAQDAIVTPSRRFKTRRLPF